MTKSCPNCGANTAQESRFCRRCGVPLKSLASDDEASTLISPLATTVPLVDDGRSTDGFAPDDPRRVAPETARVNRADLDLILRASRAGQTTDDDAAGVAPIGHETVFDESLQQRPTPSGSSLSNLKDTVETAVQIPPPSPTGGNGDQSEDEEVTMISVPRDSFGEETLAAYVPTPATGDNGDDAPTTRDTLQPAHAVSADQTSPQHDVAAPHLVAAPHVITAPQSAVAPAVVVAPAPAQPASSAPRAGGRPRWLWPAVAVFAVLFLGVAGVGGWLAYRYFSRPVTSDPVSVSNVPADAKQQFAEKLAEAESLLASGDIDGGIARLREAVALDQSDANTRRGLADLLLQNGKPREAAEEYRALTRLDANDATAWRALASIQFSENLHADAVGSYRRFFELTGDAGQQDATALLAYADALRLSGNTDEARAVYQKLSTSTTMEEARIARQRLSELTARATASPEPSRDPRAELSQNRPPETSQTPALVAPTAAPTPPPAPTPAPTTATVELTGGEHFTRGERLWSSNRAAALSEFRAAAGKGSPEAYYYLGLSMVEGKDPRSLKRAELVSALQYFQNARRGRFAGQARRYEDQLGKEFDRRRN